jgi:hypothetical protein
MRVWIVIVAVLGLLVLGVVGWVVVGSMDSAPPEVSDLAVERPEVGEGENAFPVLMGAVEVMEWPEDDGWVRDYVKGEGEGAEGGDVEALLAANAGVVEMVEEGCEIGVCWYPEIETLADSVEYVGGLMQLGRLLWARGRWLREEGEWAAAAENSELALRYGGLVVGQPESLVNFLVGLMCLQGAVREVEELVRGEGLGEEELASLAEVLGEVGGLDEPLARAFRCEYWGIANTIDQMLTGELEMGEEFVPGVGRWGTNGYLFHPNRTKGLIAEHYRGLIGSLSVDWWERGDVKDLAELIGVDRGTVLVRPNGVGRILVSLLVPMMGSVLEKERELVARVGRLRASVALRRFELAEGRAAVSLAELVPGYLEAVPVDPFTGEAVGYDSP